MSFQQDVDYRWGRFHKEGTKQKKVLMEMSNDISTKFLRVEKVLMELRQALEAKQQYLNRTVETQERLLKEIVDLTVLQYEKERKERDAEWEQKLAQALAEKSAEPTETRHPDLDKAATIAIFDSVLFAIENWSTDGQTAPDFDLASKAFLFPTVYDKVMGGNEDYVLKTVPFSALEVVKRGREYVKWIRETHTSFVTDSQVWPQVQPLIAEWWRNDALPLLYGARDPAWDSSSTLSLDDIISWRDEPHTRPLKFPLVHDAMDLLSTHGEAIRDTTGLPQFTRQTIDTRLEVN